MKYDFNQIVDRKGSYSVKWDLKENVIPLWVADMDFHVALEIEQALIKRAKHGVYGYSIMPKEYFDAEISWWKKRFNTFIDKEWIVPTIGVIPALSSSTKACTNKKEKVIVMSPVYQYFYSSVTNNNRDVIHSPLLNNQGIYTIDFHLLEQQAKKEDTALLILCNPHNPVGRVWTKDELKRIVSICKKNNVIILSDEIHRDLTYERDYTPILNIKGANNISITCTAPSKTFNIAGLKTANIIIPNKDIRDKVKQITNEKEVIEPSIFGIDGLIAAYNYGEEWLEELLVYLKDNREFSYEYFKTHLPQAIITPLEGTYLLWVDLQAYNINSQHLEQDLIKQGVYINGGYKYEGSNTHIRINLATSREILKQGYDIITSYIKNK